VSGITLDIEMATQRASANADWVVGTVQTLHRSRKNLRGFKPNIIVVDEWHHYDEKNKQYHGLKEKWPEAKFLGLTATPYRFTGGDLPLGVKLIEMDIGVAVHHDYLVPPKPETLFTNVSLKNVKTRAGDFAMNELSEAVNVDVRNQMIAKRIFAAVKDEKRQGILFGVDVAHAQAMAEILRHEVRVGQVYGETPKEERRELMKRVRGGDIDVLVNNLCCTEGFDVPHMSFVGIARPTKSLGLFCLDSKTEILTRNGWAGYKDVSPNDSVASLALDSEKVKWSKIRAFVKRGLNPGEYMVGMSSPTMDVRVTDNHNLVVKGKRVSKYHLEPASVTLGRKSEYLIPISAIEDVAGADLTDDEIRFIGWVITDGTINKITNGIAISQSAHQPYNRDITRCLKGCSFKYRVHTVTRDTKFKKGSVMNIYTISKGKPRSRDKHLSGWGRLSEWVDKDLPSNAEKLDRRQLGVLLEAMHLGDGTKMLGQSWTRRSYHISTGNLTMANRLQSLCVRRGYKCNLSPVKDVPGLFFLHIKDTTRRMVGGQSYSDRPVLSKLPSRKNEVVWCVETDYGTIITRRNGKVAVLGNCQMMGRGLRICENKKDCLVIDVHDTVKVSQSRVTYSDLAAAGDIDGARRRNQAIIKEPIADKLKNFPIVMRLGKGERWIIDNTSWFAPAWSVGENMWVITWSKNAEMIKTGDMEWAPITRTPHQRSLHKAPKVVRHAKFGEGVAHDVMFGMAEAMLVVEFDQHGKKNIPVSMLEQQQTKVEKKRLSSPIRRAFFICLTPSHKGGRLIVLTEEGREYTVNGDIRGDKNTIEESIRAVAVEDDMLNIVKTNAHWRSRPATKKQVEMIEGAMNWGKLREDIELEGLTGGDASSLIDQIMWKDRVNQLFGSRKRQDLIGYNDQEDDV
jgi:hypothetical protein